MPKETNLKAENRDFFAAANSGRGFISFYNEIFNCEDIERRYLIKGGPGTGKSTFMRRVAEEAENAGMHVERYRCSSDPASLDGVIINRKVAIIDSTAPHTVEPELVGARDILVDLGVFWNSNALYELSESIKALCEKKKRSYALAYRFLSSAMQSDIASRELMLPYVNNNRLTRLAKRLTRSIDSDGSYECRIGLSRAIGMGGRCVLDTYMSLANKTVYIEEHYGIGNLVLCKICEEARNKGCKIAISYDPLSAEYLDSVFFEESKLLFVICESRKKGSVSLRRILDTSLLLKSEKNELKAKSRYAKRISESLVLAAADELKSAGDAHFELEKIYRSNMDFSALDLYTSSLIEEIIEFSW